MITVITGPMGSGKSLELIRFAKNAELAGRRVHAYKPSNDDRSDAEIKTRFGNVSIPAIKTKFAHEIIQFVKEEPVVILIDEVQFIENESILKNVIELSMLGHHVIIGGLNRDFLGRPFGLMPQFMALADDIILLKGVCAVCGQPGTETQRLRGDMPEKEGPLIICGDQEDKNGIRYECRCKKCVVR